VYALLFSVIRFRVCSSLLSLSRIIVCLCVFVRACSLCVIAIWSSDHKVIIKPLEDPIYGVCEIRGPVKNKKKYSSEIKHFRYTLGAQKLLSINISSFVPLSGKIVAPLWAPLSDTRNFTRL